jgi:Fic-DOC domain mobile mystery protein B
VTALYDEPQDATPLTPEEREEREGLIPSHVTFRHELNELEQQNIITATVWAYQRRHNPVKEAFARNLHRRMFGKVWRWAGAYRKSNKNLGVDHADIIPRLYQVMDDVRYWIEHGTYQSDETALRFHHCLVVIHPFPNGNGRWSRLMADILVARLGQPRFTWGGNSLQIEGDIRRAYIEALQAADRHDFTSLLVFSRS